MGDAAKEAQDIEFGELIGFLQDQKLEVQRFAAEGVLAQTDSQDFLDYCRRFPRKAAKGLLRLAERAEADAATSGVAAAMAAEGGRGPGAEKAARNAAMEAMQASETGSSALQALVNISAIPTVRDECVELKAPRRIAEAMRSGWLEGRSGLAHWYTMVLANITTGTRGQEAACEDEAMIRFLVAAYIAKPRPPPRDGHDDPLIFLGRVLNNMCAVEAGRQMLAGGEQGAATISTLVKEISDRGRRADVVSLLSNLCLDTECHPAVLVADPLPSMAKFLYPWDTATPEQRAELPEALRSVLAEEGATFGGDVPIRHAAAICMVGLCRTAEGRDYLRSQGILELLRAWKEEECEQETKTAIDTVEDVLNEPEKEAVELPTSS